MVVIRSPFSVVRCPSTDDGSRGAGCGKRSTVNGSRQVRGVGEGAVCGC